jgi:5-methylcytosine-specific restriction endonuclease McrA
VTLCALCFQRADEGHHFVTRARGGEETIPACTRCHRAVHNGEHWALYLLEMALRVRGIDTDVKYICEKTAR